MLKPRDIDTSETDNESNPLQSVSPDLGPDYMRRRGPVHGLARKTGQPASLVCCMLNGS